MAQPWDSGHGFGAGDPYRSPRRSVLTYLGIVLGSAFAGIALVVVLGIGTIFYLVSHSHLSFDNGCTKSSLPLNRAVSRHDTTAARQLLDATPAADPNRLDSEGRSALGCSIADGARSSLLGGNPTTDDAADAAQVRLLLTHHADPNGRSGHRPLIDALRVDEPKVAAVLEPAANLALTYDDAAPQVRVRDAALTVAASNGDRDLVGALLAHGADPNRVAYLSPLLRAAFYGHRDVVRLLLAHGADPNAGTADRTTVLLVSVNGLRSSPVSTRMAQLLRGSPNDSAQLQRSGPGDDLTGAPLGTAVRTSPLGAAIATDDELEVRTLLLHGASPARPAFAALSPLHLAAAACEPTIAADLVAHGAPVGASDRSASTCLAVRAVLSR